MFQHSVWKRIPGGMPHGFEFSIRSVVSRNPFRRILDFVDSTAVPVDRNKIAFTHRGSGPIILRKSQKSDNAFYNGGWTAEASGRGRIVASKKGVKDFFLVYMNGRLVREATPFYEINIDYGGKSCLPRRIRNAGGSETAAFSYHISGLRPLLSAVSRGGETASFKYGEFEIFTGPKKNGRELLLKEAAFGDRLSIKIEYYARKKSDTAINGAVVKYSTPVCEFSKIYEWDASTGEVKKIDADFYDVKKEFFPGENPKLRNISVKKDDSFSNSVCSWEYDYEKHVETLAVPAKGYVKKVHYRVSSGYSPKLIRKVEETVNGKREETRMIYSDKFVPIRALNVVEN